MRRLTHPKLKHALLVAALFAPASAMAQGDGAAGPDGSAPEARPAKPAGRWGFKPAAAPAPHMCAKCAAAKAAREASKNAEAAHVHGGPPAGWVEGAQIVGCAHSSNGVCADCRKLLALPGEMTVMAPGTPAGATAATGSKPGHAVASDSVSPPGFAVAENGEPEPIGVMRTTYNQGGAAPAGMGVSPSQARMQSQAQAMNAGAGSTPYLGGTPGRTRPHILGHLFGFSVVQRDMADKFDEGNRRKKEKHAAISYDSAAPKVEDLPSSAVYGPSAPK